MTISINTDESGQVQFTPFTVDPNASTLQTQNGGTVTVDPTMALLLSTSTQANVSLDPPGISAKDFLGQTTSALIESRQEDDQQKVNNPLYYKLFGLGLVGVLARIVFLNGGLETYVTNNNNLSAQQDGFNSIIDPAAAELTGIQQNLQAAANTYNAALEAFNNGQITQAQYDAALATYNGELAAYNVQLGGQLLLYNIGVLSYGSQLDSMNATIDSLNAYTAQFTPPGTPIEHLPPLTTLSSDDLGLDPVEPGEFVNFDNVPQTAPDAIPLVDQQTIEDEQITPLSADQDTIKRLLQAGDEAVDFNAALKQFGLRSSLTIKVDTAADSTGTGSSAAFSGNSVDPASQAKTLPSDLSKGVVQTQILAMGIPAGSPLVAGTGYLVSTIFGSTGLYSIQKALEVLGLSLPAPGEPGVGPVTNAAAANGQAAPVAGEASINARVTVAVNPENAEEPNPLTGVLPSATPGEIESLSTTVAAVSGILAAADVLNGDAILTAVTSLVDSDPNTANLSPDQRAKLINAITGLVSLDLSLTSLFALSIALGAPSLMQQYLGNVAPLASRFPSVNNQSPFDIVISNPASIVFFQNLLANSLQNSLNISQDQAAQLAETVIANVIQQGQANTAQQLQDIIRESVLSTVADANIQRTRAIASSNQAIQDLSDTQAYNAAQAQTIQEDQLKNDIATSLIKQNINEADASRAASVAVIQNRAGFRDQLLDTDAQAKETAQTVLRGQIIDSLSGAGIPRQQAEIAAEFAFDRSKLIGQEAIAIKRPVVAGIIDRNQLAGEIQTLVYNELVNLGLERANAISSQIVSTVILSPNSFYNRNNAYIDHVRNVGLDNYDNKQEINFDDYIKPTKASYITAMNFMDPGLLASHNIATGVMYSQPVAIKNTPPILG